MQFGDTREQHTHDVEKIYDKAVDRRYAAITFTEAGPASNNLGRELIRVGKDAGYQLWVPSEQAAGPGKKADGAIAVRKDLIRGDFKREFTPVIPSAGELYRDKGIDPDRPGLPNWAAKGLITVSFESVPKLGDLAFGVSHHLTGGRFPNDNEQAGIDHYEWNEKLDHAITLWIREQSKGSALAFFNCDRNVSDKHSDQEIAGATTLADELRQWQPTGHGDIDWMLSANRDGRVSGRSFTVLDDREFFLHGDHYFCEGVYNVEPRRV
jgi:hypothetical protein